jgi:hypothetical protein
MVLEYTTHRKREAATTMRTAVNDYPFVIRQAADMFFIEHVEELTRRNLHSFTPNNVDPERRKYLTIKGDIDSTLKEKKLELIDKFKIVDWVPDSKFYDLIGYISEGGSVHPHRDGSDDGRMHIRINLLVSKPESGCVPMLDGIPIDIDLGDAWLCFASHCEHSTTPVRGSKNRSIVSYGLQVDAQAAFGLFSKYMGWKMAHSDLVAATP